MTLNHCISALTCLYVAAVMVLLLDKFFKRRENVPLWVYFISIFVVGFMFCLSNYIFSSRLTNAIGMLIPIFFASFLFDGNIAAKLIISVLGVLLIGIAEIIIMFLIPIVFGVSVSESLDNQSLLLLGTILSKLLLLVLVKIVSLTKKQRNNYFSASYWILFCLIFLNSILAIFLMFRFSHDNETTYTYNLSIICSFGILFSTFFALYLYDHMMEQAEALGKQRQFEQQIEYQAKHLDELLATQTQFRKYRHDLKNHLITLKAYFEKNNIDDGLEYIGKLDKDLNNNIAIIDTGNIALDSIIGAKKTLAQSKNIDFITNIQIPEQLPIDATDICIIFGNALDNAIEACESSKKTKKYISLSLIYENKSITCKISNTYDGNNNRNLKTTKKDNQNHGFGIENIQISLSKYKHIFEIYQYENEFVLFFNIFN